MVVLWSPDRLFRQVGGPPMLGRMPEPLVSVIVPLFGDHRAVHTLPAVCRNRLRQSVPCEVVVAVAEGTPLPDLGHELRRGRIRVVPAARDCVSPGPLRNLAVSATTTPLLYLGDADVAPLGADFLENALALKEERAVIQPWMYRLVNPEDGLETEYFDPPPPGRACHVTVDADGLLHTVGGERFTRFGGDLMAVDPKSGGHWIGEDGKPWRPSPYHWGGIMLTRAAFDAVGRYSARYLGYGCEDDDLIAKLDGTVGAVRAWRMARHLSCLHFEHPRGHTFAPLAENQRVLEDRLAAGVAAMIEEDR
jgi:hypothetical protein